MTIAIRVENISEDGNLNLGAVKFISPATHALQARSQLCPGDILFSIAGALGRSAVVPDALVEANTNQAVALVRLVDIRGAAFAELSLAGVRVQEQVALMGAAQAQANLSLAQLGSLQILWPPPVERLDIEGPIAALRIRLRAEVAGLGAMRRLKSALSSALLTGEIRVMPDEDAA